MLERWGLIIGLFLMMFLLSGCVKAHFHVTVNQDGSAELDHRVALNSQFATLMSKDGDPLDNLKKNFEQNGFTTTTYKEDQYVGVEAKKHIDNLSVKADQLFGINGKNPPKGEFTVDHGLFYDTYHFRGHFELSNFSEGSNQIAKMFWNQMDMKFSLTMPAEAMNQNASRVSGDQVKTYEWDLIPGKGNDVTLDTKVLKVGNVIGAVVVGLLFIAGVMIMLRRRRNPMIIDASPKRLEEKANS